jgi:hypothetical protein
MISEINTKASFLLKNEVKKSYPLTVVIDIELSKNIPFFLFSKVRMSFLGTWMKVSPKNTLLGLKLE